MYMKRRSFSVDCFFVPSSSFYSVIPLCTYYSFTYNNVYITRVQSRSLATEDVCRWRTWLKSIPDHRQWRWMCAARPPSFAWRVPIDWIHLAHCDPRSDAATNACSTNTTRKKKTHKAINTQMNIGSFISKCIRTWGLSLPNVKWHARESSMTARMAAFLALSCT